ncbi:MAG TPA: DNA recombination protein RmuC [Candidatus Paceibacterota bacterium]|nr:DNA recombination protein RmuC [Candidatus Paceibacterota bacterium]
MEWLVIALLIAILALMAALFLRKPERRDDAQSLILLQNQLQDLSRAVDQRLGEGMRMQVDQSQKAIGNIQQQMDAITNRVSQQLMEVIRGVTETKESTKQVFTIAEQLQNLEKVLKNQKQRGNLGEASLELILSNVLPGQYEPQYLFKDGEKVDFAVKTRDGLVPVDAKFPLENYVRLVDESDEARKEIYRKEFKSDVKKRIDETAKYIRPEEGTMPFAIMFIPAESIYYDLLNSDVGVGVNSRDLIEYAYQQKNVIIASPTTFLAYLQTILFGNQRAKIQETAQDIIKNVSELGKHLAAYQDSHNSLGKSLSAAVGHYEKAGKAFKAINKDVVRITEEKNEISLEQVEKPMLLED